MSSTASADSSAQPPAWARDVIWYQIFVERFHNGDPTNDPRPVNFAGSFKVPANWAPTPWTGNWYEPDAWAKAANLNHNDNINLRRYGGDLQGVLDKLDYLQELGVTALYLNPVNDAPSLHKYDARSYHHIDVNFGPDPVGDNLLIARENPADPATWQWTAADRLFLQLVQEVHRRRMRIIVDYSWNHTGVEFWAWQDILKKQQQSAYKDWYDIVRFNDPATPGNEFDYNGWLGLKSLPEIKKVNITTTRKAGHPYEGQLNEGAKQHVEAVTRRWLAPDGKPENGVDGFRLDVADQVPMGFWRDYRPFVKSIKPEAYLVGEVWWEEWPNRLMNPVPYLSGDVFDGVMFYQVYRPARCFFAAVPAPLTGRQLQDSLERQWSRLPAAFPAAQMNVSASHDSPRLLTCFANPGIYKYKATPNDNPAYHTGRPTPDTYQRVRLYLLHQFTSVGAPHIWNGDELGMWGSDDPDCRKPLWWPGMKFAPETRTNYQPGPKTYDAASFNAQHFAYYKQLIRMRKATPVFGSGSIQFLPTAGHTLAYSRGTGPETVVVLFNLEASPQQFRPLTPGSYRNLLDNSSVTVGRDFALPPLSGLVLQKSKG
ncbi:glycoside hydrolase family 13 protein [Hymenobacter sp. YC55]|uniref:glycoside hydrolase family 13 protein n=1 Tax=Hymenobacter sp. YC55 TaxID=3034019 RepID=UPI0023F964BA|nr:glycoside hydrolase family 13 protein [Hymenobacter sp. YC55]MDF7812779.1 glycoside hydrolase family 13 protein [Hymenobacter sp. YC55]